MFLFYVCVLAIIGSIYDYFVKDDAFRWMTTWWLWLVIIAISVPPALLAKRDRCAAGAEWLSEGKSWVKIYELTSIEAKASGTGMWITLKDKDGREVDAQAVTLQYNRRVWDLLYNGMLHSAVNGAYVNTRAQRAFRLPSNDT